MVNQSNYQKDDVEACLSVMVELMTLLGEFRDYFVIVGGWVPYFLIGERGEKHTGSLDIDVAVDFRNVPDVTYRTILQLMKNRGYEQNIEQPFIFYRTIKSESGIIMKVQIDLLAAEYGGTGRRHRTQKIQDVRARKARGADLAFQYSSIVKLKRKMPDGAENEVVLKVADVIPFLVMKGMAMWDRYSEKDAYDVYFIIRNYQGGITELAKHFKAHISNSLVREGLGKICAKFSSMDSPGPVWVANFLEIGDEEEKDRVKRDVFERVNTFLAALGIKPFEN
jgi:hypothetical protein